MKMRTMIVMVTVALALIALPTSAQDAADSGRRACNPEGTWFGSDSMGESYITTITGIGGGRYQVVSRQLTDTAYCAEASAWRGEMARTGLNTYEVRLISLCDAYGTVILWAAEGEFQYGDCDHVSSLFVNVGIYFWGTDFTPFVDAYDIPFVPPEPAVAGSYDRMPAP